MFVIYVVEFGGCMHRVPLELALAKELNICIMQIILCRHNLKQLFGDKVY